jgi:hypothetical protein
LRGECVTLPQPTRHVNILAVCAIMPVIKTSSGDVHAFSSGKGVRRRCVE